MNGEDWTPLPILSNEIGPETIDAYFATLGGIVDAKPVPQPIVRPISPDDGTPFFRRVNDAALLNLGAWVPQIFPSAKFQPGTGAYRVSSRQLGRNLEEDLSLAPSGVTDFGVSDMGDARQGRRTPIDVVMEWGKAPDAVEACKWLCTKIGMEYEGRDEFVEVDPETAKLFLAMGTKSKPTPDPITLGQNVDWTRPEGLLRIISDWILETSPMPNRPLAVAAATAVVSTVCGRHLYSATGTSMNLYIACLARTAVGKDRPFYAPFEILTAAGLGSLHTTAKSFSVSGFEGMIVDSPCCVATVDEMGTNLLARISHWKASSQEGAIKGALQELWSRVKGKPPFSTTRRVTSKPVDVHSPSLTLFGASTPEQFYDAMKGGDVMNGFMNRFLIATAAPRSEDDNDIEPSPVPQIIIDSLTSIIPELKGNLGGLLGVFSALGKVDERRLEWGDEETHLAAKAFKKSMYGLIDGNLYGDLFGRTYEYMVRLAGIHAVSRAGAWARVGMKDLHWGAAWALESARAMADAAENLMAKSEYESKMNDVKKVIRDAKTISRSNLLRAIRHLDARDCENITNHLAEAGVIQKLEVKSKEGAGRPAKLYRWVG